MGDVGTRVFCPTCFKSFPADTTHCPDDGTELVGLPRETSLEGSVLDGKYEIGELLGRGGMGTVYRATQKMIDREVALKILRPDFTSDMNAVKRFFREAKAVARLRSPHAVILYDFGLAREGHLYYTMELVRGWSLAAALRDQGAFDTLRAVRVMLHVARALEEAHSLGIVHRDLKPSNIMLVGTGLGEVAKVLDFGIAKLVTGSDANTLLTDSGMAVGTPKYMSPEQATGGQVDYRSDLYSLGVIFYELLAGLHPFQGGTPSVMMHRHVHEEPVPVRILAPEIEVPVPVERLLGRLLAKRPGERPRRVTEVTSELDALLEGSYDPRTTRMPRMATSPTGLRQIVEGTEPDDSRWAYISSSGLADIRKERSSSPEGEEDGGTSDGIAVDEPSAPSGDHWGSVGAREFTRGTEDFSEGTDDLGTSASSEDATPLYQKAVSADAAEVKEDWRSEDFIPMDGKNEWTTTSKHIPRVEHEDTGPPQVEWDAPSPDWESPSSPWDDGDARATKRQRRRASLPVGLMLVLAIVVLLAAALHYQLLDGLVQRFGLGGEDPAERQPAAVVPASRPGSSSRGKVSPSAASSPSDEDPAMLSAPTEAKAPALDAELEGGARSTPKPVPSSIEELFKGKGVAPIRDLGEARESRRNGLRAAAAEDYEAAIELFKLSLEQGGDPADLNTLIDESRRKQAEQFD